MIDLTLAPTTLTVAPLFTVARDFGDYLDERRAFGYLTADEYIDTLTTIQEQVKDCPAHLFDEAFALALQYSSEWRYFVADAAYRARAAVMERETVQQ